MRTAIVSDIHGNLSALLAVVADLKTIAPDRVVLGGDLVVNGARPAEVVDLLRDLRWPGVLGNTDEMLWRPDLAGELQGRTPSHGRLLEVLFDDMAPFALERLGGDRLAWLEQLPTVWSASDLTVVHASVNDLWRAPLPHATDVVLREAYSELSTPRVVYGHIHRPYVRSAGNLTVANAGSVGLSYDGDARASYAVADDDRIWIRRVDYDHDAEIKTLREVRCPHADWLGHMLRTGTYRPPR